MKATVHCAACKGKIGEVLTDGDGFVVFNAEDPRIRRRMKALGYDRNGPRSSTILANPKFSGSNWVNPEHLDVWCRRCGPGRVATSAVRHAYGKVFLDIK